MLDMRVLKLLLLFCKGKKLTALEEWLDLPLPPPPQIHCKSENVFLINESDLGAPVYCVMV